MAMKITLDKFLELNNSSKIFLDNKIAEIFYKNLKINNTSVSIAALIPQLERIGWYTLNKELGNTTIFNEALITIDSIEQILNFRIDDLVVTLSSIPNTSDAYGNYLLTDILKIDSEFNITLAKEEIFLTNIAFYAANKPNEFKNYLLSFSKKAKATFVESLSYFLEAFILYRFIINCTNDSLTKEYAIFNGIIQLNLIKAINILIFANTVFYSTTNNIPVCRLRLQKIKNIQDYITFINTIKDKGKLLNLVNTLDIVL